MKYAKILLVICICLVVLASCKEPYYYENVDTGILAVIDESQNNTYGVDHLIINDEHYSMVKDENTNIVHAYGDDIELLEPFANFGEDGAYTLYEIKTDLPFKVYIDNKNRAVFCLDENVDACREYFLHKDYFNYQSNKSTSPSADNENNGN